MKDMLAIIIRTVLAIVAIFVIIIVFAVGTNSSEDKRKIRQDQERMVQYVLEKAELQNKEEIKKIKFVDYEKNTSTGAWHYDVVINDKIELYYTSWRERKEVVLSATKEGDINLVENKKNINESNIEVIYVK